MKADAEKKDFDDVLNKSELYSKARTLINQKKIIDESDKNIKNNDELKAFVMRNLYLIDDEPATINHLEKIRESILEKITQELEIVLSDIDKIK